MDDYHLTYKICEVYAAKLSTFFVETISNALYELGKSVGKLAADLVDALNGIFTANEEIVEIEYKQKQLRPIKCIKPTHKAPVYRIIPYVRNRC